MVKLLAFDYGASSGRAIMAGFYGEKLALNEIHRFSNDPVYVNGYLYWDILRLYHEMKQGISKCAREGNSDIVSLGVDSWTVDYGLLSSSGELLGNPLHYRDLHTEGIIEQAEKIIHRRDIYQKTGIQFLRFNTLYQMLSMKMRGSSLLENASTLLIIPDLLNYFLTGEKLSEYTVASTTQIYNPALGDWDKDLIIKMGLPTEVFTDIIPPGSFIGNIRKSISDEMGFGSTKVIAVASHDTASAVAAVPAYGGKYVYISSGTWSLVGVELPEPIINDISFKMNYTNEGGICNTIRFLKNVMGLWIYQECKRYWDKYEEIVSFDDLEESATKAKEFASFIDPDDELFISPGNMPDKIREYCRRTNQRIPEDKPAIVRCIMESLALKYRMTINGIEQVVGYELPVIHIVGGGSRNVLLNQFTANATGKPVIAGPIEAAAIGNILSQLISLKHVANLSEARMLVNRSFPANEYKPVNFCRWEEAYQTFKEILQKGREMDNE